MMKCSRVASSSLLLVLLPLAWARAQGVSGTAHDFTTGTGTAPYNFATGMCETCHVPHGGTTGLAAPLWNHTVTSSSFTLYTSSTLDASLNQPAGVSRLCLSCHDGTVAVDAYGGSAGTTSIPGGDPHNLGTNLSNDHPISFTYDAALASTDGGLQTPSGGSVGTSSLPLYGTGNDQLECATCHNPHGTANDPFLRHAAATICTQCHVK